MLTKFGFVKLSLYQFQILVFRVIEKKPTDCGARDRGICRKKSWKTLDNVIFEQ